MKFLTALNSYIRDSVLPMIILAIMLTFSILLLVTTVAQVGYIMYDYDVVASAELDNAYYISNVMSAEEFNEWYITPYDEVSEKFETMRSDPSVESVFTVRSITSSFYGNRQLSIVIFEREMLDYFPELKKSGLNFTDDPYGCILATPELNSYKEGDTLEMSLSGAGSATQALNVLGHVSYPYHGMTFSSGGNNIDVSSLFSESGGVFMLYSDELMATLMERNAEIKYNPGYMVVFKDAPNLDLIFTSDEQAIPFFAAGCCRDIENSYKRDIDGYASATAVSVSVGIYCVCEVQRF